MIATGTPRKCSLAGVGFDVFADTDLTINVSTEKEGVATSGNTAIKVTKKVPMIENLTIMGGIAQFEALKAAHKSLVSIIMSLTFADGSSYSASGQISVDNWTSADGKATVKLIPETEWTAFIAS